MSIFGSFHIDAFRKDTFPFDKTADLHHAEEPGHAEGRSSLHEPQSQGCKATVFGETFKVMKPSLHLIHRSTKDKINLNY